MSKKYAGRCACGAITFEFDQDPEFVANCHCLDCKKASGGEMATFFGVAEADFTLLTGSPKGQSYVAASGKKLVRNFCAECGARVFSTKLESFPGLVFVTLGITPKLEMFTKRRLPWNKPLDVPQFDGMPG